MQAQDYLASKWALGARLGPEVTDAELERKISSGKILRTHVFRGTWQLVAPDNVRWMLAIVRESVLARAAGRHRQLHLDAKTLAKSLEVIRGALEEQGALTRNQLGAALSEAKISPEGQRLPHILQFAELQALICNGPLQGKQHTFALLDARAPKSKHVPTRAESLAKLALLYFQSRAPATLDDFAWWTGLSKADARAGLEAVRAELAESDGYYWSGRVEPVRSHSLHLLPAFDEYLIAYRKREAVLDRAITSRLNDGGGMLDPIIVRDGEVIGTWKRTLSTRGVRVDLLPFGTLTARDRTELALAEANYRRFLARPE